MKRFYANGGTASEVNADYFVIKRSEYQATSFVTIDTVSAKGNSPDVMRYRYADAFKSNKCLYYQLRQADKVKKFHYSSMISVSSASESEGWKYPNPVSDKFYLDLGEFKTAKIKLFNLTGKVVLQEISNDQKSTNVSTLLPGTYLLL